MSMEFEPCTDEYLTMLWEHIDLKAAEEKLADLQYQLTRAAYRKDGAAIEELQNTIVRDLDIKCLAVRHVVGSSSSPGVDGVKWRTPAEKMRGAMSLTSKDYHPSPLRQIMLVAKNTGKKRYPQLPTYRDRAMLVLYGYALIPVTEAYAERKSFAFRPGRSTQDAHAYVIEMIRGEDAPAYIFYGDVKACYAHIQHDWLIEHAPMDKHILRKFLKAGIVFEGELFPSEGEGLSEGSNLSPYLANFTLDGMQRAVYEAIHGTTSPMDYGNGNLLRFADDILVTVRTKEAAETVRQCLTEFLAERGLAFSEEKTRVYRVEEGFTFLSRTYVKKDGLVYSYPADAAVERFIEDLRLTTSTSHKSQRELILLLNRKLKGWAGYYRCTDATAAFRKVDAAVQTALLETAIKRHPKMALAKVKAKYWYREADGHYCYALPNDKSVRVVRLADTVLLTLKKPKTSENPFTNRTYYEARLHTRDIHNVTGPYRAIWERQEGRCYYCGRPILSDQPRTTVQIDLDKAPSIRNSAYVHQCYAVNEFEIVRTMEDISILTPYDMKAILEGIAEEKPKHSRTKKPITQSWKHYKLKRFFAASTERSITLTFQRLEEIDDQPLPKTARMDRSWWNPRPNCNMIAEAWLTEGYELYSINLAAEKLTLHRQHGTSKLTIPKEFTDGPLPENAVYELETHMQYIIKKYGLKKPRK